MQEKIDAYEAAGLDVPKHLRDQLGSPSAKARKAAQDAAPGELQPMGAVTDVPQPMAPGTVERGTPLSPRPDTVPEPEDGSAPDKRAQDQRPVGDPVRHAKEPGPEYDKARALPVQPQPGEAVENSKVVEKARLAHEDAVAEADQAAGPAVGDETEEEAEARRKVANATVPAPDVEPRPTPAARVEAAVKDLPANDEARSDTAPSPAKAAAKKAPAKAAQTGRRGR